MDQVIHIQGDILSREELAEICRNFGFRQEQRNGTIRLVRAEEKPKSGGIVPLYGHMKTRSRINNVVQLSGIAHPHLDGPGNGGSAA